MAFNFDEKILGGEFEKTTIYHLPPSDRFADEFFNGFLSRFKHEINKPKPDFFSQVSIITSTRSLAEQIENLFESRGFIILPKIIDLSNLTELLYETPQLNDLHNATTNRYQVISNLEKLLLLNTFIQETKIDGFENLTKETSFELANNLSSLIEELNINNLDSTDLVKLGPEELPEHSQLNLALLMKVLKRYEKFMTAKKLIDKNTKYLFEVNELITAWKLCPYTKPIILVGSTGSQLATAKLMQAVSKLPQGFVILPGLDTYLTDRGWNALNPDHPQYSFISLSKTWGFDRLQCEKIIKAPPWNSIPVNKLGSDTNDMRRRVLSLLMRPGPVTDEWRIEGRLIASKLDAALKRVTLIEADNSRQEAATIGVGIKESVLKGLSVALITPSKSLARRVTAELQRWNITPNNSLGVALASTDYGIFFRQAALAIEKCFQIGHVISLLQNQHCGGYHLYNSGYTNKLKASPFKLNESFLDLVSSSWLLNQDKELIAWCNWLFKLFSQMSSLKHKNSLERNFYWHQKFLYQLIQGYDPDVDCTEITDINRIDFKIHDTVGVNAFIEEQLKGLSKAGKFSFWTYRRIVEKLLGDENYTSPSGKIITKVFIWGTLESRTRHADVFVLAGLNEGTWPGYYKDDLWLSRSVRTILGLDLLERKVGLSAHDFQQAAMAKTLILSRSKRDNNIPSVASRWLIRLENLLSGLGKEGNRSLENMRLRGRVLSNLALELYSSDFLIKKLNPEIKYPASRPAPIPPLRARPNKLSVTEIDKLIKNPYHIYAKRILNLRKLESFRDTLDYRTKGNLIHVTLEKFISENMDSIPEYNKACELLREKFNSVLINAEIPMEVRSIWKAQFDMRVFEIIAMENRRRLNGKPLSLEVFGRYSIQLQNNEKFLITAKADRIDKGPDGFIIYDYKTGQVSNVNLQKFSPQLDIEALMLNKGKFTKITAADSISLSLVGLGNEPKQYEKNVTAENLEDWHIGLVKIIEEMKIKFSPFVACFEPVRSTSFSDDFQHLSRFGEWSYDDEPNEFKVEVS